VIGISTSLVYRVEPVPWAITIALGILAVLVGAVPLLRADPRAARWSVALGIAWVPATSPSPCGRLVIRQRW
jgi:hypothetical protein